MAKGRKPNALAQSHVQPTEIIEAPVDATTGAELAMPASVAMLPNAELCWHMIMDNQTRYRAYELPLIEQYCIAYATCQQALDNMIYPDAGTLQIVTGGSEYSTPKKSPNFTVWKEAVNTMRMLSGQLGLDTLTAERLNLTRTTTASIAADLPAKIRQVANEIKNG
mgnify:CR=1 FL=1